MTAPNSLTITSKPFSYEALAKGLRLDVIVNIVCEMAEYDVAINSHANPLLGACLDEVLRRAKSSDIRDRPATATYWVETFGRWWSMEPYDAYLAEKSE